MKAPAARSASTRSSSTTRRPPGLVRAVDGVTLDVEPGASLAITGPSGCGKSTLLGLIGGLEAPTAGRVSIGGQRDLETVGAGARPAAPGRVRVRVPVRQPAALPHRDRERRPAARPARRRGRLSALRRAARRAGTCRRRRQASRSALGRTASARGGCACAHPRAPASSSPTSPRAPWTRTTRRR